MSSKYQVVSIKYREATNAVVVTPLGASCPILNTSCLIPNTANEVSPC